MPERNSTRIPKYRLHKPTQYAVVRLNGRDIYLGMHGTDESRQLYQQVIAEWLANNRQLAARREFVESPHALSVAELMLAYLEFASSYYVKNGQPTREQDNIRDAMRSVSSVYSKTLVADFGPSGLRAVRQRMMDDDLCRRVINSRVNRIRRMFKWGVERELVPPTVLHGLQAVAPLKRGRSAARETEPVSPVPQERIDEVLKVAPRQIATMIRLQFLTGMRPGEVVTMRTGDLDRTGKIWAYKPGSHKTEHHGRKRIIYLGPQAQRVVLPFLKRDPGSYTFSPADVVSEMRDEMRRNRKTRVQPSQANRRKAFPKRPPGDRYTPGSYARAIAKACARAFPPPEGLEGDDRMRWMIEHRWSPNRLRHNAATFLRKEFGIEAARVVLGHSSSAVTEVYAELDLAKAADIMAKVG